MRGLLIVALVCVCVATAWSAVWAADGTCRALAMSGGGDKAAYEAGVLRGLLENLPTGEAAYDVVTGISAGSTLTAAFSVFELGDEKSVVEFVYNIIADLNQTSIFREWPGGIVEGLLQKNSIFDSTPLRDLFERIMTNRTLATTRVTCMGAANVGTGKFDRFCAHNSTQDAVNAALASAAIPGIFINQQINGNTYIDGGTLVNNDVSGAVAQCLALGYDQQDVVVDVIECGGANMTAVVDPSALTTIPIWLRTLAMRMYNSKEVDYEAAVHAFPDVNFRYRIYPSQPISGSGIDFNRTQMIWMESLGEQDAARAVKGDMLYNFAAKKILAAEM